MRPCSRHVLENELEGRGCLVIRHELIQDKAVIQRKARTESMRGHNEGDYMGQIVNVLTSSDPQMVLTSNPQEETTTPPCTPPLTNDPQEQTAPCPPLPTKGPQ